jgi:PhoPQ-activated pathogenicity-related protein
MRKLLALVLVSLFASSAFAEAKVEKVCHDKNGKQVCKSVKVHKKVEGTPVPEKAPATKKK